MSGAGAILCGCCGTNCTWCTGIVCTTNGNGPVKLDCRGNCTVSLNFGVSGSFGDLDITPFGGAWGDPPEEPDILPGLSFVPKQRLLLPDGSDICIWTKAFGNLDGEFYRDRVCFDNYASEIIAANKDRWLYRHEAGLIINEINTIFSEAVAPTLPPGVDRDDPEDRANWRLLVGYAIVDGQYTESSTGHVWHFPTNDLSKYGIYLFGVKYVLVSEICAGSTIEFDDTASAIPDVAPFNTYAPLEGREGTMSVVFNPDVPDNTHLATDLSPAYLVTFHVCKMDGESDVSYTREVTVFQAAYPDSRSWSGTSVDGVAALALWRFGDQIQENENAPGDGDETLFTIGALIDGENFDVIDIDIDTEFLVPIGRRVQIYENESEGFTVQVVVTESATPSPNDPPCPPES